jgi:hypothetical protein
VPTIQLAPLALRGTTFARHCRFELFTALLDGPLAPDAALLGLVVQGACDGCRTAPRRKLQHCDGPLMSANTDGKSIARLELLCRFGALAVKLDLTALDRLLSRRARFVKARGPQPLVDP